MGARKSVLTVVDDEYILGVMRMNMDWILTMAFESSKGRSLYSRRQVGSHILFDL
jgi:hypothetical protein